MVVYRKRAENPQGLANRLLSACRKPQADVRALARS
jgi:hypothetical protein